MEARISKKRKIIVLALAAAAVMLALILLATQTGNAAGEDENKDDRPDISIEVVEDIPAADIEEEQVPLADSPDTDSAGSTRRTVVIWTVGALVIAYCAFILSGMKRRKIRRKIRANEDEGVQ